jgi:hypothetical protein
MNDQQWATVVAGWDSDPNRRPSLTSVGEPMTWPWRLESGPNTLSDATRTDPPTPVSPMTISCEPMQPPASSLGAKDAPESAEEEADNGAAEVQPMHDTEAGVCSYNTSEY